MSRSMRILLGVFLVIIALGFLAIAPLMRDVSPQAGPAMVFFGALCAIGAVACFSSGSHPVTIRILGGVVFAGCLMYLIGQLTAAPEAAPEAAGGLCRSRPSLLNSLILMTLVGLPSAYAAATGRYPGWGTHSAAFGGGRPGKKTGKKRPADPGARPPRPRPGGEI